MKKKNAIQIIERNINKDAKLIISVYKIIDKLESEPDIRLGMIDSIVKNPKQIKSITNPNKYLLELALILDTGLLRDLINSHIHIDILRKEFSYAELGTYLDKRTTVDVEMMLPELYESVGYGTFIEVFKDIFTFSESDFTITIYYANLINELYNSYSKKETKFEYDDYDTLHEWLESLVVDSQESKCLYAFLFKHIIHLSNRDIWDDSPCYSSLYEPIIDSNSIICVLSDIIRSYKSKNDEQTVGGSIDSSNFIHGLVEHNHRAIDLINNLSDQVGIPVNKDTMPLYNLLHNARYLGFKHTDIEFAGDELPLIQFRELIEKSTVRTYVSESLYKIMGNLIYIGKTSINDLKVELALPTQDETIKFISRVVRVCSELD